VIAVASALLPVGLLVALGVFLKRTLLPNEPAWDAIERITYYILFPALLFVATATADLSKVPVWGIATALVGAILILSVILLALRVPMQRRFALSGPAYTSVFQGVVRWNTYVALGIASALLGEFGLALAAVALAGMIPLINIISVFVLARYASHTPAKLGSVGLHLLRNPFIWACALGVALNASGLPLPKPLAAFCTALGQASLPLGLLVVGAGVDLRSLAKVDAPVILAVAGKLLAMPALALTIGYLTGVSGPALAVIAIAAAVPSAPNGYMLARQMGGDAPLMARILTAQIFLAALSIPAALAIAAWLAP
jgi:malonate transporter